MRKHNLSEKELSDLARKIANRIWKTVPEIPKVSESRNWLQSEALDVLSELLNKKIKDE